jgi:hypothetical protein
MSIFKIPFVNTNQTFNITLSGKNLLVTCNWNQELPAWVVSIQDAATQEYLIAGVALVTGVNLFRQFYYTGIRNVLVVYTNGDPSQIPTFDSLGNESQVLYITGAI